MTQFGGSLRFVQLAAVTQLLAELGSTGRLAISDADWSGEIVVREGQIVGASFGAERGRAALEAIAIALPDSDFAFKDEPVADPSDALVPPAEQMVYLDRLSAERQRLAGLIASLGLVPRLVEAEDGDSAHGQITIGASALQLIPALASGRTLEQVARERGLVRTLRDTADLLDGRLLKLDPTPVCAEPAPVKNSAPAEKSAPLAMPAAARPVAPLRSWARRYPPPAAILPRFAVPTEHAPGEIPAGVAARLAAARAVSLDQPSATSERVRSRRGWRKALVSLFFKDVKPESASPEVFAGQPSAFGAGS